MSHLNCLKAAKFSVSRLSNTVLAFIAFNAYTPLTAAVEPELLWLPRNYNHHYKTLYRAANTVEQHDRCAKVIAASLSESESNIEHPVFKITCRDHNRISFVAIVDGFTNEIMNLPPSLSEVEPEPEPELSPAEIAQQAREAKLEKYWQLCFSQVEKRSRKLKFLQWLHEERPEPVAETETLLLYFVDFDARSESGEKLEFRAHCEFEGREKNIEVYARNLQPVLEMEDEDQIEESLESKEVDYTESARPVLIPEPVTDSNPKNNAASHSDSTSNEEAKLESAIEDEKE